MVRRLGFLKILNRSDMLGDAADHDWNSQPTGALWVARSNDGGVSGLAPAHGGRRPSKLTAGERQQLREYLENEQPWKTEEVRSLIEEEFGVTYHPNYIYELVQSFDVTGANAN